MHSTVSSDRRGCIGPVTRSTAIFCGVQVDKWDPGDDINEVHVSFTLGRVGTMGYGTRHSRGCLFAVYRREHARWVAGLIPTPPRRAQTGLYRSPGREVSRPSGPNYWKERKARSPKQYATVRKADASDTFRQAPASKPQATTLLPGSSGDRLNSIISFKKLKTGKDS